MGHIERLLRSQQLARPEFSWDVGELGYCKALPAPMISGAYYPVFAVLCWLIFRYSQQSGVRKGGGGRDARSQTGSRSGSRGTPAHHRSGGGGVGGPGGGYNGGRHAASSPGSTTEDGDTTAGDGETTETDSQAPPPDPRIDYHTQM